MSVTINHQTNDISATGGSLTIDGAAAGGAYSFLSTTEITTSVSSVEFTSLSGYDSYKFVINGIVFDTADARINFNMSTDNGSTYPVVRMLRMAAASSTSTSVAVNNFSSVSLSSASLNTGYNSNDVSTPSYYIEGLVSNNGGNPISKVEVSYVGQDSTSEQGISVFAIAFVTVPSASVNAIKFAASSGNLTAGKISIYGVAT